MSAAAFLFLFHGFFLCLVGAWLRHDLWFLHFIVRLDHHRAFYAFLLDLTGDMEWLMNVAGKCFVIRMAAAGAEEFRPAVDTFRLAEDVVHAEVTHHLEVLEPFIDVADDVAFSSDELVAGVNIAIRYDGEILVTGAAAAKTLREAGALPEVHIEMEEEEWTAFFFSCDEELGEAVIFRFDTRQILFLDGVVGSVFADDRFHGYSREALVDHIDDVGRKVHVVAGEGTADIVFLALAVRHAVLEILHDLIIGAFAMDARTHTVMHFLAAVKRQDETDVIVCQIFDLFLVEQKAIRGEGHLDLLAVLLFLLVYIVDGLLYDVPVHERFTAEEIKLAVFTRTAVCDEEIDSSSGNVEAHQHAPLAVAALSGEAVLAAQIAVVSDIDAERFDDRTVFDRHFVILIHRCKEYFFGDEFIKVIHDFIEFGLFVVFGQIRQNHSPVGSIVIREDLVRHIIDDMYDAAVHVHDDIHAVLLETVDHWLNVVIHEMLFSFYWVIWFEG